MTPTTYDIQQQILTLERERSSLPTTTPNQIEERIQIHAARAIPGLDGAAEALATVQNLLNAKDQAIQHQARIATINQEIARLNRDLQLAKDTERWQQAGDATRLCDEAYAEYLLSSKQTARAFRRLLSVNQAASVIKGAVPRPTDTSLHLPAVWPAGWSPPVGIHMVGALLPFEQSERKEQNTK